MNVLKYYLNNNEVFTILRSKCSFYKTNKFNKTYSLSVEPYPFTSVFNTMQIAGPVRV